jgi:hypothetical protein
VRAALPQPAAGVDAGQAGTDDQDVDVLHRPSAYFAVAHFSKR